MKWLKSDIAKFLYKILGFYLVWFLVYNLWLLPAGWLDAAITKSIAQLSHNVVQLLGYTAFAGGRHVGILGTTGVIVANGCSGISQTGLFIGFMIAYPGRWGPRALLILAGIVLIYIVNVLRIATLVVILKEWPESFSFMHHYATTAVFYVVIFGLWALWFNNGNRKLSHFLQPGKG